MNGLHESESEVLFLPLNCYHVVFADDNMNCQRPELVYIMCAIPLAEYIVLNGKLKIPQRQAYLAPLYYYDESAINTVLIVLLL